MFIKRTFLKNGQSYPTQINSNVSNRNRLHYNILKNPTISRISTLGYLYLHFQYKRKVINIDIWKRQIMPYLNSNANNIKRLLQRKIREIIRKFSVSLFKDSYIAMKTGIHYQEQPNYW